MKYAMIMLALVLGTQAAQAGPTYQCTTQLPAGSALLYFNTLDDGSTEVQFRFNKSGFSRPFVGTFKAEFTNNYLIAQGNLNPIQDNVFVTVQGYFKDNQFFGTIGSLDRRIASGFGNPIECTLANQ